MAPESGKSAAKEAGKSKSKRGAVEAALFEKHRDAWDVERFSDFCRDSFEERAFLDDGAHLFAEGFENLLGIVGVAEKAAVGPLAEATGRLCGAR